MATLHPKVDTERETPTTSVAAVIALEDFQDARRDQDWQRTLAAARAYRAQLELEGRNR
jgi:hypothetical protein